MPYCQASQRYKVKTKTRHHAINFYRNPIKFVINREGNQGSALPGGAAKAV